MCALIDHQYSDIYIFYIQSCMNKNDFLYLVYVLLPNKTLRYKAVGNHDI